MAACNRDPELTQVRAESRQPRPPGPEYRSHTCPARSDAYLIAETAISYLEAMPGTDLAVPAAELRPRPGAFHRAPEALPVRLPTAR
ncbi:hypothetical protein ACWGJT_04450 [Streptomyces xantholiticus]